MLKIKLQYYIQKIRRDRKEVFNA